MLWWLFYISSVFCLFGIYLLWVIYKLLARSRSLFALTLLFLSSIWCIYSITVSKYLAWALPLQCWIFANRYFKSYLKSNATTTKFTLTKHTYITVIFSIVIVALCTVSGYLVSWTNVDICFYNCKTYNDIEECYRL